MVSTKSAKDDRIDSLKKEISVIESELKKDEEVSVSLEHLENYIREIIEGAFGSEAHENFFINEMLPRFVNTLLKKGDVEDSVAARINEFFQTVISFVLRWINKDNPELFETLSRILSQNAPFFVKNTEDRIIEDSEIYSNKAAGSTGIVLEQPDASSYLVSDVKLFVKLDAFDKIMERIKNQNPKAPLPVLKSLIRPVLKIRDFVSQEFLKAYVEELQQIVFSHILSLTHEELKNEERKNITEIQNIVELLIKYTCGWPEARVSEVIGKFNLQIALKLFNSPYLEKRLQGLNDIKELTLMVFKQYDFLKRQQQGVPLDKQEAQNNYSGGISPQMMIEWIKANQILENLFGQNMHIELLKRSSEIVKFLAFFGLDEKFIDLIFEASVGKHESIRHIIYVLMGEMAQAFNSTHQFDYLFEKIKKIKYSEYDVATLQLVRSFSISAITMTANEKKKRPYGLEIFWELAQDECPVSLEIEFQALHAFGEFVQWNLCHSHRVPLMEACIENIAASKSVPQSLRALKSIIVTFPEKAKKDNIASVINWLETQHKLLDLFFKDLILYKQKAKTAVSKLSPEEASNINNCALVGKHPHLAHVKERLDFLDYVLASSELMLSIEQIDIFWNCQIHGAITHEERESSFQWLESARSDRAYPAFSDEATQYIFERKIPELDFSTFSLAGSSFFEFFFRYVNWKNAKFEQEHDKQYIVLSYDLIGVPNLWRIALEARDPLVGKQAISLLTNLQKNLSKDLKPMLAQNREQFVRTCMSYLSKAASIPNDPKSEIAIERCLLLLQTFFEEFEVKVGRQIQKHGAPVVPKGPPMKLKVSLMNSISIDVEVYQTDTIGTLKQMVSEKMSLPYSVVRLIAGGKELKEEHETIKHCRLLNGQTVFVAKRITVDTKKMETEPTQLTKPETFTESEVDDENAFPSFILSKQEYFDQLFELLNLGSVAQKAWDLIMHLPTNRKMLFDISTLHNGNPNWDLLLDTRSTFKLLYSLQITESRLTIGEDDSDQTKVEKTEWRKKFLQLGGVSHLFSILLLQNFYDPTKGNKRKLCLSLLLKIVSSFILTLETRQVTPKKEITLPRLNVDLLRTVCDTPQIIPKLLEILWFSALPVADNSGVAQPFTMHEVIQPDSDDVAVVNYVTNLLAACCMYQSDMLHQFLHHPSLNKWLSGTLLSCIEEKIRERISGCIYLICNETLTSPVDIGTAHNLILEKLLSFLNQVGNECKTCEEYFDLLSKLVGASCDGASGGNPEQFTQLLAHLVQMIKEHPIVETRNSRNEDVMLVGILNLTRTIVSKRSAFKTEVGTNAGLLDELFYKCLFEIPDAYNHGALAPPKCKRTKSRKAAFRLLTELCRDEMQNFQTLTSKLMLQHTEKRTLWSYLPTAHQKSSTGYVGLKNLGATCYMNSLMQQLFMVPPLRYGLLSVPIAEDATQSEDKTKESLKENLLYQIQTLLANLQESEKKYYDTREFCKSYKPDGQPINPTVQMDADEFFNMLFDKIENMLKGTKQETLLKDYFGGVNCNQIISKECEHISERDEGFFTVGLEVKNKKNIIESLNLYTQGDVLEGENKYFCGQCQKKVDALKRTCIKTLPDNLIVHLKRFEFDFELFRRVKVNDYCEFPMTLNMESYTKEGLLKKENPNEYKPIHPPEYYEYELTGILVHTGTADSGHYYSFIRQRHPTEQGKEKQWYQFNDTDVEPFDPKDIPKNCYGGFDTTSQWDAVQNKYVARYLPKIYSAYMLFYERVRPEHKENKEVKSQAEESRIVPERVFKKIWEDNMAFLVEKNIFDPDYFNFVWSIVTIPQPTTEIGYDAINTEFDMVARSIELGTRFVFATLSHAKEKPSLRDYVNYLRGLYSKHLPSCRWLLDTVVKDNLWLKQILFQCPSGDTRDILVGLFIHVMTLLVPFERSLYSQEEPMTEAMEIDQQSSIKKHKTAEENPLLPKVTGTSKSVVIRFIDTLLSMLKDANSHWATFGQYFQVFKEFASLGEEECKILMARNTIGQFIDFYLGDESPYASYWNQKRPKMGDKFTSPSLGYMLDTIAILSRRSSVNLHDAPSQLPGTPIPINVTDVKLLTSEQFHSRALRENINPKASADIAVHLCWQDEAMSTNILKVCTHGINMVDHDGFKPYFEVMTPLFGLQDSLQTIRIDVGLKSLIDVINENAKYPNATYYALKYIFDLMPTNSLVTNWLLQNQDKWLENHLMSAHESVRDLVSAMVIAMIPGYPSFFVTEGQTLPDPATVVLTDAATEILDDVLENLLHLLRSLRVHWRVNVEPGKTTADYEPGIWRIAQYFRLLRWLTRGKNEKSKFTQYFQIFISMFSFGDDLHYACDDNKKEMCNYWYHCLIDMPENVRLLTSNEKHWVKLFDFFISLSPQDRYVKYNRQALPSFYNILRLCCEESQPFLQALMGQSNFEWAIRFLYMESSDYEEVAKILLQIMKTCSSTREFRLKVLPMTISDKVFYNYVNIFDACKLLIQTPEDAFLYCKSRGLECLQRWFEKCFEKDISPEIYKLAVSVFIDATSWLADTNIPEKFQAYKTAILQLWDQNSKTRFLSSFLAALKRHPKIESSVVFTAITILVTIDNNCCSIFIKYLIPTYASLPLSLKSVSFYSFCVNIIQKATELEDTGIQAIAIDLAINLAKDVVENSDLSAARPVLFNYLGTVWDNKQQLIKSSNNVTSFIGIIFDSPQAIDASIENFLARSLSSLKENITEDKVTNIINGLILHFKNLTTTLQSALSSHTTNATSLVERIGQVIKAVHIWKSDEVVTTFQQQCKEEIDYLSKLISSSNTSQENQAAFAFLETQIKQLKS